MHILYIEPFLGGSHQSWIEAYKKHSRHNVEIIGLPDKFWKWRMIGGAIELADRFNALKHKPDVLMVSDMLDLATFKGLIKYNGPIVLYFHENQITYPFSPNDTDLVNKRDNVYGFINFSSAIAADKLWFNSDFHQRSFLNALTPFLNQFPDFHLKDHIPAIFKKSKVVHLGMDLNILDELESVHEKNEIPILLWNHRWEHDKNPRLFFESLLRLKQENIPFNLVALGEQRGANCEDWTVFKNQLKDHILHWGYVGSYKEYISWLKKADILPVTSHHDYFGISVVEAIYSGCLPLLPNNLAYPEHILDEYKSSVLYDEGEYYPRLKSIIINKEHMLDISPIKAYIQRYDWSNLATVYDNLLDEMKG